MSFVLTTTVSSAKNACTIWPARCRQKNGLAVRLSIRRLGRVGRVSVSARTSSRPVSSKTSCKSWQSSAPPTASPSITTRRTSILRKPLISRVHYPLRCPFFERIKAHNQYFPDCPYKYYTNGQHDIFDAVVGNVLVGGDGNYYFIDTIIYSSDTGGYDLYRSLSPRFSSESV